VSDFTDTTFGTLTEIEVYPDSVLAFLDGTPPVISNVSPAPGAQLASKQTWSFDVTDERGLTLVVLLVKFPSGRWDAVFDGTAASPQYGVGRTVITNGYHFTITPVRPWPGAPTFVVLPCDKGGNVSV
jgi:hypothetical protein